MEEFCIYLHDSHEAAFMYKSLKLTPPIIRNYWGYYELEVIDYNGLHEYTYIGLCFHISTPS